jgi:hypothetical protein
MDHKAIVLVASLMGSITGLIIVSMLIKLALVYKHRDRYDFAAGAKLRKFLPTFLPGNEFKISLAEPDAVSDDISEAEDAALMMHSLPPPQVTITIGAALFDHE